MAHFLVTIIVSTFALLPDGAMGSEVQEAMMHRAKVDTEDSMALLSNGAIDFLPSKTLRHKGKRNTEGAIQISENAFDNTSIPQFAAAIEADIKTDYSPVNRFDDDDGDMTGASGMSGVGSNFAGGANAAFSQLDSITGGQVSHGILANGAKSLGSNESGSNESGGMIANSVESGSKVYGYLTGFGTTGLVIGAILLIWMMMKVASIIWWIIGWMCWIGLAGIVFWFYTQAQSE